MPAKVGILLFDEVEVLDFAGPYEVFSLAETRGGKAFEVLTVAAKGDLIRARNGLKIQPDCDFYNAPRFNILIVPGGYGAEEIEIHSRETLEWIKKSSREAEIIASVCTGAFLLAEAGLLDGKQATTHWIDIDRFKSRYPQIKVVRSVKFVDSFSLITSGGISAGINMSLYIVEKLLGREASDATAKRMDYDPGADAAQAPELD